MSTLFFDETASITLPDSDVSAALDPASNFKIVRHSRGIPSDIEQVIFGGAWYQNLVALCDCAEMELYRFGIDVYTKCPAHGLQMLGGQLRRDVAHKAARR